MLATLFSSLYYSTPSRFSFSFLLFSTLWIFHALYYIGTPGKAAGRHLRMLLYAEAAGICDEAAHSDIFAQEIFITYIYNT